MEKSTQALAQQEADHDIDKEIKFASIAIITAALSVVLPSAIIVCLASYFSFPMPR